ncbi:MAG: Lar family restriction alleviation protein [Eubacterium sp.]|nr:Lar family restriction alleviation protein [Eubacterium sp.]
MNDEELKPCPFCGGEAKLEDLGFPHHVYCTNCGARITGRGFGEDGEADAIKKWNMRKEEQDG